MIIDLLRMLRYHVWIFSSHISLNVLGLRTKYVFLMELSTLVLLKLMQKVVFVMYLQKKFEAD